MGGGTQDTSFAHIPNNAHPQWWRDAGLRRNVVHVIGICLCPFYLGYDQSLLAGLQAIPGWQTFFNRPAGLELGLISACIFLPALVMCFVADYLCTKFGRKKIIYIGSLFIVGGAIFNGLSRNRGDFMGSRVLIGTGGAITKVAAPSLLQEICHPRYRGRAGTSYYSFYYSGSLTAALLCVAGLYISGEWTWRLPCIVQIVGPTAVMVILWDAPESPRWLARQGRHSDAETILAKYHADEDEKDESVEWQLHSIVTALAAEDAQGKSSYMDFFKTTGNRKRLFVDCLLGLASNWVGNGIITYYLAPVLRQSAGITQPNIILGINAGYAAFNWACSFLAGIDAERLGRRFLWLACNIGMGVSFAFVMGFAAGFANTGSAGLGIAVIPFLFVVHFFYDIGYISMNYSYSVEIMPYNLRTIGLALYIFFNNAGNAFNQFVNPYALAALQWRCYAVYIAIDLGMAILVYFYFPETARMTIEEISMVMDYPLKNGRRHVLEALEAKRQAESRDAKLDGEARELDGGVEGEKPQTKHVERA